MTVSRVWEANGEHIYEHLALAQLNRDTPVQSPSSTSIFCDFMVVQFDIVREVYSVGSTTSAALSHLRFVKPCLMTWCAAPPSAGRPSYWVREP